MAGKMDDGNMPGEGLPVEIQAEQTVAEVLARWPEAIPVFLRHRLSCVGCTMSPFESLEDVCAIYAIDLETFLAELRQAAGSKA